ncbi:MAG: MOSC domain-containing protein [Candidatus Riflebacteria bacterium]|nr:MOSC domain-containing protein [Candidatus Riflebacteria bacterium]
MKSCGEVVTIYLAEAEGRPVHAVQKVNAVAGRGLEGDRYFRKQAGSGPDEKPDQEVTLVELEAIEDFSRKYDVGFAPEETRRNIVTRRISLNELVGRQFKVGPAVLRGLRLCEPCAYLEKRTGKPVLQGLAGRCGLRAEVLVGGTIQVGDPVSGPVPLVSPQQ